MEGPDIERDCNKAKCFVDGKCFRECDIFHEMYIDCRFESYTRGNS